MEDRNSVNVWKKLNLEIWWMPLTDILFLQKVSHHPPISAFHAESKHWIFWQEYKLDTKFRGQVGNN